MKEKKSLFFMSLQAGVHTSSVRSLRYGWSAFVLGERSTPRFGQYSKIFSVDGNLASGKGAFAQKLAERLGNYLTVGIPHRHHQHTPNQKCPQVCSQAVNE